MTIAVLRRRTTVLTALACALALSGLVACGDDEGGSGELGLPENPSKADYIGAGDEVCQHLYEQRDPLEIQAAAAAQKGDAEAAASIFENAAAITENRFEELEMLPRPEADAERLGEIYARGDRTAEIAREAADALRAEDREAFAEASRQGAANTQKLNKELIGYGFLVCGRGRAAEIG